MQKGRNNSKRVLQTLLVNTIQTVKWKENKAKDDKRNTIMWLCTCNSQGVIVNSPF